MSNGYLVYLWSGGMSRRLTAQKWAERSWSVAGSDEEQRVVARHQLKPGEWDLPLELLVNAYPPPKQEDDPPCQPVPPSPPPPSTIDSGSQARPDPEKPTEPASASKPSSPIDGELLSPTPSASGGGFGFARTVRPLDLTS